MQILIATANPHKRAEINRMIQEPILKLVSLTEVNLDDLQPEESGPTFAANAIIKARAYSRAAHLITMAEDSGIEVAALAGAPGVHSARYGGPGLSDSERTSLLLSNMREVPAAQRAARFSSVIALLHPQLPNMPITVEGTVPGRITTAPIGTAGFGYDPVFWYPPRSATFAQLESPQKDAVSHRGAALRAVRPILTMLAKTAVTCDGLTAFKKVYNKWVSVAPSADGHPSGGASIRLARE